MNNFTKNIHNICKIIDLRKKIIITIILLLVYRFGAYIPIPGINPLGISDFVEKFNSNSKGLMQILSSFTGGAFNRASVLALGIMPYISASIVIQLMCIIFPYFQRLQKDGESGKKKINLISRWLTLFICLIQTPIYLYSLIKQFIPYSLRYLNSTYLLDMNTFYGKSMFLFTGIITLTTGTLFTMWIGDKITDKGIGNGISIIIMSGIISRLPDAISKEFFNKLYNYNIGLIILLLEFLLWIFVISFTILIIKAIRKIPIQYVSHYKFLEFGSRYFNKNKKHQYLPLKVTSAGVMPIIFSQAIMFFPLTISNYINNEKIKNFFYIFHNIYGIWYNSAIFILVIIFTFFYTAITIPVHQISDELKRNGGHIPKIKPGKETIDYIDKILSYITLPGSILLGIIAILPYIVSKIGITKSFSLFYGGTSLIIVIGVILDIAQQIDIYLLNYHYDGLMKMKMNIKNYKI
ncbi:preprotein translocase subunit SecY [Blattabacterium cuenoti]|uniref:preprotein translocase subunit SecY n=1 Tax=Blattabacterium cuenoti TaxID=1653831 RepID=UPI00163CAAC4|nr:preprotein translocase subunit SecY [Blattabacterium cuenoti]